MGREASGEGLVRELNLPQASSLVVGIVIGSGIFVAAHNVAGGVDSVAGLFAVWLGAGFLTLLGALTFAEFGAMFPHSGGDYVYARESLGPFWGFLNGWMTFSINYPASLGALSLAWAMQLDQLKPTNHFVLLGESFSIKFTAVAILAFFLVVNYFGIRQGGRAQALVTGAKVLLILGLVALGVTSSQADAGRIEDTSPATVGLSAALVGALFSYDGWTGVTRVSGEIKSPQRNVPRALVLGILGVIVLYVLLTLAYVVVLGLDGMRADAVASRTGEALFGTAGKTFVTVLILVSILGPINGLTLAGPRVYYAIAKDRLFPSLFGRVHARYRVPHTSLFFQTGLSAGLALLFTRDQLFGFVVLASTMQFTLVGIGLIRLRTIDPDRPRPYRVPGYPFVPLTFVLLSTSVTAYLLFDSLNDEAQAFGFPVKFLYFMANVFVILLAWPVYHFFVRRMPPPADPYPV